MNDQLLSLIAAKLKINKEDFSNEEKTQEIEDKLKQVKIMPASEFNVRETNLKKEHLNELIQAVDNNELPPELYNKVKFNILDQTDKKMAENFGIENYSGHDDLVNKIQAKKGGAKTDEKVLEENNELKQKIDELKGVVDKKESEFNEFKRSEIINNTLKELEKEYPFKAENEEELTAQKEVFRSLLKGGKYNIDYQDGKAVIKDGEGNIVKDDKLDPVDVKSFVTDKLKPYVPQKENATPGSGDQKPSEKGGTFTTEEFLQRAKDEGKPKAQINKEYMEARKSGNIKDE